MLQRQQFLTGTQRVVGGGGGGGVGVPRRWINDRHVSTQQRVRLVVLLLSFSVTQALIL